MLTLTEITERLKKPEHKAVIGKAAQHEGRLALHVESALESTDAGRALSIFLDWVKTVIPLNKFIIFGSLLRFPVLTNKLTASIFTELERVFDGKNPFYLSEFKDDRYAEDWAAYRNDVLDLGHTWRQQAWQHTKTGVNSILVVDMPTSQTTGYPEPYFYFLDFSNVVDFRLSGNAFEWLIYKQPGNRIAAIDTKMYRLLQLNDKNEVQEVLAENPHNLGYCPATFFTQASVNRKEPSVKRSVLTPFLADLDWLLFFGTSKKHLDLYAPYPIYSAYEVECDYDDPQGGSYCADGFLKSSEGSYQLQASGHLMTCPVCATKRLAGAGTVIDVPVPTADGPDLRNPVTLTTVDINSLNYNVSELERLENDIFTGAVGFTGRGRDKSAMNEVQVRSNFESRTGVLNSIKTNLETAFLFVTDTICRLRYGDNYVGSRYSMGTEYYNLSTDELYAQFEKAKSSGATESELDALSMQITESKYRNDPAKMQRMWVLKNLEPYRHYNLDELLRLNDAQLIDKTLLRIKLNFITFVERFERENASVTIFGSQLPFSEKINRILDVLKIYANEQE